jgi:single-stranded-DNA-specific exonuclease
MPARRWILPERPLSGREALADALGVSPFIAELLCARGLIDPELCGRFLKPHLDHQHDPLLLPDIEPAVERLIRAINEQETILVHGDYDVDGVCSAALLTRVLRVLKAKVEAFVPHRREDGYDLRPSNVQRFYDEGIRLILTADCGIIAFDAADKARELGVDLIITDHHEPDPDGRLPDALAVIDPHRPESDYPFAGLCGTGVAYKVASALVQRMGIDSPRFRTALLDLVALATCADCMPLTDENRLFVFHGLETLRRTNKTGLKALMRSAGLAPEAVSARSLGFVLGPRINAIGRMDAAAHALELLLTTEMDKAEFLAARLNEANRERQQQQEQILHDAMRQAEKFLDHSILVLASHRWHPGIIGIVASKIAESLCRPTILIAVDEESGMGRGSCRSIADFHIFDAVNECRRHVNRCGGHAAAAGFDIPVANIEAFRDALQEYAGAAMDTQILEATILIDQELPHEGVSLRVAQDLEALEPFGHGNPEPIFMTRALKVLNQRRIAGKTPNAADHLKLNLELSTTNRPLEAVFWRSWARVEECPVGSYIDACYSLEINPFGGNQNVQLNLKDFRPAS